MGSVSSTCVSREVNAAWWPSTSQRKTRWWLCQDRVRVVSSSPRAWTVRDSSRYQKYIFVGTRDCCLRWRLHPCLVGQLPTPVRSKQPCGSSEPSEYVEERRKQWWHRNRPHDAAVHRLDPGVHAAFHPK